MDLLTFFTRSPGELLYFVLVIAMSFACLMMLIGHGTRQSEDLRARRYLTAFAAVSFIWTLLMVAALLTLVLTLEARAVMPPLERAVTVLTLILLSWIYLSGDSEHNRRTPTRLALSALIAVMAGYVWTALEWSRAGTDAAFNALPLNTAWLITPLAIAVFSALMSLLRVRVIVDTPLKFVFFMVVALGYGLTLAQGETVGDYAGVVRLLWIPAWAISVVMVYRLITSSLESETQRMAAIVSAGTPPSAERSAQKSQANSWNESAVDTNYVPRSTNPIERESAQLLRALGMILEGSTPNNIPMKIISTALDLIRADLGGLLRIQDANYADFTTVYDRMMRRSPTGMPLNLSTQPTLINAIERRAQRPLLTDRNEDELHDLYSRLDTSEIGPAYYQPLVHDGEIVAVLMVAMPYTKRELTTQEEELLKGMAVIAAGLLAVSYQASDATMMAEERAIQALVQGVTPSLIDTENVLAARYEMQQALQLARDQIGELSKQVTTLKLELDRERSRVATALSESQEGLSVSQKLIAVSFEQEQLRDERDRLMAELQEREAALAAAVSPEDNAALQQLLTALERERDELSHERERLMAQIEELRASDGGEMGIPDSMQDVLARMVEEQQRLTEERDAYEQRLALIQAQLREHGIEDNPTALAHLFTKLAEERAALQTKAQALASQLAQHQAGDKVQEYQTRIKTLVSQLKQLAADREALTRQRDAFRNQRDEINVKLETVKQHRTRLLAQVSALEQELKEAHEEQVKLRLDTQTLSNERSEIFHQLAQVVAEKEAVGIERDQLIAQLGGDSDRINAIGQAGIEQFQAMISEISVQRNQLQREVNELRAKSATLENQLEAALVRAKATTIETTVGGKVSTENADLLIGLVQEFRTPLTSMIGYTELLLNESAGILGDMQRKFLQRVAANVKRLGDMLDDLIYITQLDTGKFALTPVPLDMVALIEQAVNESEPQFRERGLVVALNIEDPIQQPLADLDAVKQIIGQLLTNAYLASPIDSEVSILIGQRKVILARDVPKARPVDCVYVSIADAGGGVMPEDVAKVFTRKYRAENPLVKGLGDTGVGLSVAKALVEAHHGRIWVETSEGTGTTAFNFVLPLTPQTEGA